MNRKPKSRNLVKVTAVITGAITIVSLLGYLIFQMITASSSPPDLQVNSSYNAAGDFYNVVVENSGDTTAEEVTIKLQIVGEGRIIDTITISMRYVPGKSKKKAMVTLPQKESFEVNLEVLSIHYQTS